MNARLLRLILTAICSCVVALSLVPSAFPAGLTSLGIYFALVPLLLSSERRLDVAAMKRFQLAEGPNTGPHSAAGLMRLVLRLTIYVGVSTLIFFVVGSLFPAYLLLEKGALTALCLTLVPVVLPAILLNLIPASN